MNQAIKTQWVAALRSGDYKQGRHVLNSADGFCCLGVLCDLAVKAGVADWGEPVVIPNLDGRVIDDVRACNDRTGVLPLAVMCWAGLDTDSPEVIAVNGLKIDLTVGNEDDEIALASLNDAHLFEFPVIADLIEVQL